MNPKLRKSATDVLCLLGSEIKRNNRTRINEVSWYDVSVPCVQLKFFHNTQQRTTTNIHFPVRPERRLHTNDRNDRTSSFTSNFTKKTVEAVSTSFQWTSSILKQNFKATIKSYGWNNRHQEQLKQETSKLFDFAVDKTIRPLQKGVTTAREETTRTIASAWENGTKLIESNKVTIVKSVQNGFKSLIDNFIHPNLNAAWTKFYWWSLAAIAVYGISTTIPQEIVKNIMKSNNESGETKSSSESNRKESDDQSIVSERNDNFIVTWIREKVSPKRDNVE